MQPSTLKSKAYQYIKGKIVSCEYEPGCFLDEKQLIEELQASRTPIREALNKIEQENLIQIIPKKGIVVSQITLKNILDVYQVREVIEPAALSLYGQYLNREKLLFFREGFENDEDVSPKSAYKFDAEFHAFIISGYNNEYITNLMDEIRSQNHRIQVVCGKIFTCFPEAKQEHLKIIDDILNHDYASAHLSLREHIVFTKNRTMEQFQ